MIGEIISIETLRIHQATEQENKELQETREKTINFVKKNIKINPKNHDAMEISHKNYLKLLEILGEKNDKNKM